jgi:hypothetical protein
MKEPLLFVVLTSSESQPLAVVQEHMYALILDTFRLGGK